MKMSTYQQYWDFVCRLRTKHFAKYSQLSFSSSGRLYISWLLVVSLVFVYNAWVIPLRTAFNDYQTEENLAYWLAFDYFGDFVYFLDIVLFKSRIMYLDNGFWISTPRLMRRFYMKTRKFKVQDLTGLLKANLRKIFSACFFFF